MRTKIKKRRKTGLIYGLQDPDSGIVQYIGQTIQTATGRLKGHRYSANDPKYPVNRWVKELLDQGKSPLFVVLRRSKIAELDKIEKKLVKKYRKINPSIKNATPGGQDWWGSRSNENHSRKSKSKIKIIGSSFETWPNKLIFNSINQASKHTNAIWRSIESVLDGKTRHAKGWFFCKFGEELQYPRDKIKIVKKVYCSNGKSYPSINEAAKQLNIHASSIGRSMKRKIKANGLRFANNKEELKETNLTTVRIKCIETQRIYESLTEASKDLKIDKCLISEVLRKKQRQTKGYSFEYVDPERRKRKRKKLVFTNLKSGLVKRFDSNKSAARYFRVHETTIGAHLADPDSLLSGYSIRIEVGENDRRLKKKPKRLTRSLFCLTNKKVYSSTRDAERDLGIKLEVQLSRDSAKKRITRPFQFLDLLNVNEKCLGSGIKVQCIETGEVFKTAFELSRSINEMLEVVIEHLQGKVKDLRGKRYKLLTAGLVPA